MVGRTSDWTRELGRFLKPFLDRFGHKARRQMCPLYVSGLIGPGDRKSIAPMAKRLGLEMNLGITYDTSDRFHSGFAYGLLLPFSGLRNLTPPTGLSGDTSIAHAMKFILAIPF